MRMPAIPRGRALAYLALVLGLLALGGRFLLGGGSAALEAAPVETLAPVAAAGTGAGEAAPLVVHVAGAVRRPGVYRLPEGSRVADAVEQAGGATRRAELGLVNLAALLVDGQQVLVPRREAGGRPSPGTPGAVPGPLSLSTATLEELDGLPGVGPVTAQRILDYRDSHGPFASVDELDAVPGIGPARLEQLRELVVP